MLLKFCKGDVKKQNKGCLMFCKGDVNKTKQMLLNVL